MCRQVLEEISNQKIGDGVKISLQDIPALSQRHFPMCMQHLYNSLMADRHLRHAGRQQFGLFLKKAGLNLEESMLFWKTSFAPRTPSDKFEKEYAYNIRHSYGKEGGRKDYEAQRCSQIIPSNPGVGEANGCPFKTFDKEALKVALGRQGLPNGCETPCVVWLEQLWQCHRFCNRYRRQTLLSCCSPAPEAELLSKNRLHVLLTVCRQLSADSCSCCKHSLQ